MVRSASFTGRAKVLGAFAVSLSLSLAAFAASAVRAEESGTASPASEKTASVEAPARVLSAGGAVTEIVYALGAGERLIATDVTSLYPEEAKDLPKVGYFRQLAAEPIVAMDPDLLLVVEDAGPEDVLRQLKAAGMNIVTVPDETSPAGVLQKIGAVGAALGLQEEAKQLEAKTARRFEALETLIADAKDAPRVVILLSAGRGAPLAGGAESSADAMIKLAGGTNAFSEFENWKPVSAESLIAAAPDVIVVPSHVAEAMGGKDKVLEIAGVAETPAGRERRFVMMDSLLLLGFGPRTPEAAQKLARVLHPELAAKAAQLNSAEH